MKSATSTLIFLLLAIFTNPAGAKGAIAFSFHPDTISFVVAVDWNQPTMVLAEDRAMAACRRKGGRSCSIVQQVEGECVAIAVTNEGRYRVASGATQMEAQRNSVNACLARNPGDSCIVRKSFCDNSTGNVHDCRSDSGYDACMTQGRPAFGGAIERQQYCRMAFC